MNNNMNLVELTATVEEQPYNQQCKFGNLVANHAVYCHCPHKDAQRKCKRTWYTAGNVKDEDCPYFKQNNNL